MKQKLLAGWRIQKNVVFALYTRELKSRFGHYRLGYVWAVAEPVALIVVLSAIRLALGNSAISGVPYPHFFATGIIPFLFFQTTVTQSLHSVESNLPLLNYKVIKPCDTVFARCLLETMIYTSTGLFIIVALAFWGLSFELNDLLGLIVVLACLLGITIGASLLASVCGALYKDSKKIVPILIRPLFFLSGVFFAANALPYSIKNWMLLNPLLQVNELIRKYMFTDYQSNEGNLNFLIKASLICLASGLAIYRLTSARLATSGKIQ